MKIRIIGLGLKGSFSYDIKELYPNAEISDLIFKGKYNCC